MSDTPDLTTMTRTAIIEWWRGEGYTGPVSYTKADMIPKVQEWLGGGPAPEAASAEGDSNVTPIKPKRSRSKKAATETPTESPVDAAEAETSGEAEAAADA